MSALRAFARGVLALLVFLGTLYRGGRVGRR